MKKLFIVVAIALSLAGCQGTRFGDFIATAGNAITAAENAVTPQQIYIAANAFDAVKVSATNYLELRRCPTNAPITLSIAVVADLIL